MFRLPLVARHDILVFITKHDGLQTSSQLVKLLGETKIKNLRLNLSNLLILIGIIASIVSIIQT